MIGIISFVLCSIISIDFKSSNAQPFDDKFYTIKNVSADLDEINLSGEKDFSFNISNGFTDNNKWSIIHGNEINVTNAETYYIISYMGLNPFAVQSHIGIEGFNKTSGLWEQLFQCPQGMDGPLELTKFVCNVVINPNIIKIRPVFEAGWSSEEGQKAITTFNKFIIIKKIENTPIVFDNNLRVQEIFDAQMVTPAMKFLGKNFGHLHKKGEYYKDIYILNQWHDINNDDFEKILISIYIPWISRKQKPGRSLMRNIKSLLILLCLF